MARMSSLAVSTALLFLLCLPSASHAVSQPKPRAVMLPVRKDAATGQYLTTFRQRTPLVPVTVVLDLANPTTWVDCQKRYVSSTYRGVHCASKQCRLTGHAACGSECYGKPGPSCLNNTCGGMPDNTVTRVSTSGDLLTDVLALQTSFRPGGAAGPFHTVPEFLFTCGPTFLTKGLAAGATGMASLSRNRFALPAQLAATFGFSRKFALCLPSSAAAPSFVAIGDAPHTFQRGADLSNSLTYTPLLLNPVSGLTHFQGDKSDEYFIGVTGIKVNGRAVPLNATRLAIDREGNGGTKLSTARRYTVLEPSIYKAVTAAFAAATAGIPRAPPVAPFKLCYDGNKVGRTRVGPAVPTIELTLQNKGASWVVFGANSMVAVKGGALCLGVVDGGEFQVAAVELGGNMLEDNLLEFDLEKSRLGFSSSLLFRQTTCSNFHLG